MALGRTSGNKGLQSNSRYLMLCFKEFVSRQMAYVAMTLNSVQAVLCSRLMSGTVYNHWTDIFVLSDSPGFK